MQNTLKNQPIFSSFSDESLKKIAHDSTIIELKKGETLNLKEYSQELLIIIEGQSSISEIIADQNYFLGIFSDERILNPDVLTKKNPQSLIITSIVHTKILSVSTLSIFSLKKNQTEYIPFLESTLSATCQGLEDREIQIIINEENKLSEEKKKSTAGKFITFIVLGLILFIFTVDIIKYFILQRPRLAAIPVLMSCIIVAFGVFKWVQTSKFSAEELGLHLKNWKQYFLESSIWSFFFITFALLLKYIIITNITFFEGYPLLYYKTSFKILGPFYALLIGFIYALTIPIQQFIFREGIHVPLLVLLEDKHKNFISILISTLFFSVAHIPFGIYIALTMLAPGVLWAILFQKQKSLLGVTWSHFLIGMWTTYGGGEFYLIAEFFK